MGNTYSEMKQEIGFLELQQVQRDSSAYSRAMSSESTEAGRGQVELIAFVVLVPRIIRSINSLERSLNTYPFIQLSHF